MKGITEDYVSEEVAKLLQMKGFDESCDSYYEWFESGVTLYKGYVPEFYHGRYKPVSDMLHLKRPTHQMALKWLREVHNIVIEINLEDYMTTENGELQVWYSYTIWTFIRHLGETGLTDSRYDDRAFWQENVKVGQSYEEAVEAALLYVLKNLI